MEEIHLIYFDNGATTKPYQDVIESFLKVTTEYYGNPSSLHRLGSTAEQLIKRARSQIANLLAVDQSEVIFTSGGTESNNLAIKGIAFQYKDRGHHLITTVTEHASVKESFEQLKQFGFDITYLPVDNKGLVNLAQLQAALRTETILVSVAHVNNEVGTVQPIREIGEILKDYEQVFFHVDNVQGIGKVPLNLKDCHVDLCSYSAHKFHGLKGNGILYKSSDCELSPLFTGGQQEAALRSGTENVAGIVAMARALRLTIENMATKLDDMTEIKTYLINELRKIAGVHVNTPIEESAPHIVNFSVENVKSETLIHALGEQNIYLSTTSACSSKRQSASKVLTAMGVAEPLASSGLRISLSYNNTLEEAQRVISAIKNTLERLRKVLK